MSVEAKEEGWALQGNRKPRKTPGTRLKLVRKIRGFSQRELAKRLGVTYASVSWMEREQNDIKASTATRLAAVLGCSPGYLAFGSRANTSERARELVEELRKLADHDYRGESVVLLDELAALLGAE